MFSESIETTLKEFKARNKLYAWVIEDVTDDVENDEELYNILMDITRYGGISGSISSLVYYADTENFFNIYREDINKMLAEACENAGCNPSELLNDFDMTDPLCIEQHNINLLAWWAYETVCYDILNMWDAD